VGFVMIGAGMDPTAARPHMPGYGISDSDDGLLPFAWAEERLSEAFRYWVATISPGGAPHVMPVWAVWLGRCLWFSTGGRSRKARNLRADPRCTIHTDGVDPVIVHGTAEFVTEPDAIAALIEAYARKYPDAPPDPAENPIVRVRPQSVFGLIESEFATSPTRWTF
jgi:PPOX class probable F420-dependent enzyme